MAAVLLVLMNLCNIQAGAAPIINWVSDSYNSFDVIISGTGLGWSGSITSPSGLWQLQSDNMIDFESANGSQPSSLVFVDNVGTATFEGQLPPQFPVPDPSTFAPFNAATIGTYGGYEDAFKPVAPIDDKNGLTYGFLNEYGGWSGMSTISITTMPNEYNPSTWRWVVQYSACGDNLDAPEPGTLSLFGLGVLIGVVRMVQRIRSPGFSHDGKGAGGGTRPLTFSLSEKVGGKPCRCRLSEDNTSRRQNVLRSVFLGAARWPVTPIETTLRRSCAMMLSPCQPPLRGICGVMETGGALDCGASAGR
jgi:PEP-CTERM motif